MTNEYLRHTLATIQYRFQKSVKYKNDEFENFSIGKGSRSPKEIINHMYSVLNATKIYIEEERQVKEIPEKLILNLEIERFEQELKSLDMILSKKELPIAYSKRLLQGPLSDILTHIGQIAMLSRLNNHPIEAEDFSATVIKTIT